MYRCDIRSVQQESGVEGRRLRRKASAIGARGAHPQPAAWGVRTRARASGQERRNQGFKRRGDGRRRTRRTGAATATEWRRVREVVKAVVSSTLTEAMAVAPAVPLTRVEGVVRKRVPGEARTRRRERGGAVPTSGARRTARVRRAALKELTACMLSTLPEAQTPEQDMRKPVTAAPVLAVRSRKSGPVRWRGEGPCRRVAQGRREAGPRRHGPWRGVRADGERNEVNGIEARQV